MHCHTRQSPDYFDLEVAILHKTGKFGAHVNYLPPCRTQGVQPCAWMQHLNQGGSMVAYWVKQIRANIVRLDEVPELYRENVRAVIEEQ